MVSSIAPPDKAAGRDHVVYEVSLENSGLGISDSFAIRLLNPYDKGAVWAYRDGEWVELESKVRGQYLQVDMVGTNETFCLISKDRNILMLVGGAVAGVAVLAVVVLMFKGAGNNRRRKKQDKNQSESQK